MSNTDPRTRSLSETAAARRPNRPLHTRGGSPNYLEKSLAAAAEPFRHGMPLFEMTDAQRDCAFALLRESLSQRGFEEAIVSQC